MSKLLYKSVNPPGWIIDEKHWAAEEESGSDFAVFNIIDHVAPNCGIEGASHTLSWEERLDLTSE